MNMPAVDEDGSLDEFPIFNTWIECVTFMRTINDHLIGSETNHDCLFLRSPDARTALANINSNRVVGKAADALISRFQERVFREIAPQTEGLWAMNQKFILAAITEINKPVSMVR